MRGPKTAVEKKAQDRFRVERASWRQKAALGLDDLVGPECKVK